MRVTRTIEGACSNTQAMKTTMNTIIVVILMLLLCL